VSAQVAGIRTVALGGSLLFLAAIRDLASARAHDRGGPRGLDHAGLTARERETLRPVAKGLSNAEIAERLVVSLETVKTHVGNILTKLDARDRTQDACDRTQAVIAAYESGFINPR
jgi:DNA-binding NarL/FixJ family response regulator